MDQYESRGRFQGLTRLKIESQSSGTRREDEDGKLGSWLVERLEERRSILVLGRSVQSQVSNTTPV